MEGLNKALIAFLCLMFCFGLSKDATSQQEKIDSQKKLRQEIQLLNLLSGLYFTDEQMEFLIEKAKEMQEIREKHIEEHRQNANVSTEHLEELKAVLKEDKYEVSQDLAREVHQTNKEMLELRADYVKEIEKIVKEVKNNLTSTQLYVLEEFKPCLVPPKGPARFGQAKEATGGVKQLERIRKIPDYRYSVKKYELVDRILERVLLHKPKGTELDEDQIRSRILSTFDEARELSEVDFELEKEELSKELRQGISPEPKSVDIDIKIERFLLSPVAVDLLEDKLYG